VNSYTSQFDDLILLPKRFLHHYQFTINIGPIQRVTFWRQQAVNYLHIR